MDTAMGQLRLAFVLVAATLANTPSASAQLQNAISEQPSKGTESILQVAGRAPGSEQRGAAKPMTVLAAAANTKAAEAAAGRAIPLSHLSPADRVRAERVLRGTSFFRTLPQVRVECEHEVFEYFATHPDTAVSIWRALDASQCQMWQTGPLTYEVDCGDGTVGVIRVIHRAAGQQLIFVEGEFKSPMLLKPIRAEAPLHLRSTQVFSPSGEPEVACQADVFVAFPSSAVEAAVKLVSPMTNHVMDRNFEEISLFLNMMSCVMRSQPGWVEAVVGRMDGILENRKPELLSVTARTYVSNRRRQLMQEGKAVTPEAIMAPIDGVGGDAESRVP